MGNTMRFFTVGVVSIGLAAWAFAAPESAKLVEVDSGIASEVTALTNGASFKVGDKTYRLEIETVQREDLAEQLRTRSVPIQMNQVAGRDAFNLLTHLSGVTIVCAGDVDKDAKVNVNTQDDPIMDVIEQICFQIGAEASVRKGTIWITAKKSGE